MIALPMQLAEPARTHMHTQAAVAVAVTRGRPVGIEEIHACEDPTHDTAWQQLANRHAQGHQ